jgi:hypothetical protein
MDSRYILDILKESVKVYGTTRKMHFLSPAASLSTYSGIQPELAITHCYYKVLSG